MQGQNIPPDMYTRWTVKVERYTPFRQERGTKDDIIIIDIDDVKVFERLMSVRATSYGTLVCTRN